LNDSPKFIQALGQIVQEALGAPVRTASLKRSSGRQLAEPQYAAAAGLD